MDRKQFVSGDLNSRKNRFQISHLNLKGGVIKKCPVLQTFNAICRRGRLREGIRSRLFETRLKLVYGIHNFFHTSTKIQPAVLLLSET